ncbi:hypothetical protein FQA39_LY06769 [Lamprigera yunnana]|nr:hypothetical protein FQA39_LY06769 [Lamprigera yunnana]
MDSSSLIVFCFRTTSFGANYKQKAMNKREREEVERDIFGKGKKVIRSPEQKRREERTKDGNSSFKKTVERENQGMEEIKGLIKKMMKKMDDNIHEIKQEIKLVKKELEEKEKMGHGERKPNEKDREVGKER